MLTHWIKTLNDGKLFVDLNAVPRSHRSLRGAYSLVIPEKTKGWVKSYCDISSCQVGEFRFHIDASTQVLKLTPSEIHCPLCACQVAWFEFEGCTREDAREVAKSNQISL